MNYKEELLEAFASVCRQARKEGYTQGFNDGLKSMEKENNLTELDLQEEYKKGYNDAITSNWLYTKEQVEEIEKRILKEATQGLESLYTKEDIERAKKEGFESGYLKAKQDFNANRSNTEKKTTSRSEDSILNVLIAGADKIIKENVDSIQSFLDNFK